MSGLPRGTVAVLMSDVEASTELWQRHGQAMDEAVAELSRAVSEAVGRHGGRIVQSRGEGDSHFAAFDRPSAAVLAAVDLQRERRGLLWPRIRIAVHLAEADPIDDDYCGASINAGARLRGTAHGGQIVCSRAVADVAADVVRTEGVELRSLGSHRLRDHAGPVEIFQVCAQGIPGEFPPLLTADHRATAMMAIAVIDQVGSWERVRREGRPADWQRDLFRRLRSVAHDHDGRFLKLVGDGCMVAFEDPRSAIAFADELCADPTSSLCGSVAAGLVEVIEGELSGEAVFEAHLGSRGLAPGTVWRSPLVSALLGSATGTPTSPVGGVRSYGTVSAAI